jgi:glycosyltransferase involved in cell wall biosynthesis
MAGEKSKVAAIVPAYNEEKTIRPILETLKASSLIDEVILISDGSSDKTKEIGEQVGIAISHQLPIHSGKGKAMMHGVAHTDAPILFFFYADLVGLSEEHIKKVLLPVLRGEKVMNVAIRDRGPWLMKFSAHLPLIGGERAMRRHVFEDIPEKYKQGFMVEGALNYFCRSRKLAYGSVPCPGLKIRRKMQKVGFVKGLGQYIKMFYQVLKAIIVVRLARLAGKF